MLKRNRLFCLLLAVSGLILSLSSISADSSADSSAPTDSTNHAVSSVPTDSSLFSVIKSSRNPSNQILVTLPSRHPLYDQFTAKVVDVTDNIDASIRDVNKTFVTSQEDASTIKIHNLHAGHKYSVSVIGKKGGRSEWIKEEIIEMDPKAPEFSLAGIIPQQTNITMKTIKNEDNVQDLFLVEYRAIDPEKKYRVLEIMDLPEQKELEIYLGNLFPGRSYAVRVTSVRGELKSKPWISTVTTKPESVFSLMANDLTPPCIALKWTVSPDSGADAYLIQYYDSEQEANNSKTTVSSLSTSAQLCEGIVAGTSLIFSVQAKKNDILSEPTVIEHTIKPLSPTDFRVRPDITKGKYRLTADIPINTLANRCTLIVVSENLEKIENNASIDTKGDKRSCTMLLNLVPGQRYEFALATSSHNVSSTKFQRSIAIMPAFDVKGFGLTVQEIQSGIEIIWPQSDAFLARLKDLWNKVGPSSMNSRIRHFYTRFQLVGTDSVLRLRVIPMTTNSSRQEKTIVLEGTPHKNQPLVVSSLRKGACYKIQLFTVTKTGIISETRYNESFRISSPSVNVSLETVTRTEATLRLHLIGKSDEVVSDCYVSLVVLDMHSTAVLDKKIPLVLTSLPLVSLIGLRPFHKYTVNTQVICGGLSSSAQCPPSTRTMRQLSFSTRQDRPGAVQNLKVRSLNPYSVQVSWLSPALPNGVLTHYVVEIKPEDGETAPFTVDVPVNSAEKNDHIIETIVDQLIGGERYTFSVRAVTEAGAGEADNAVSLTQPLLAPPRPTTIPQIVADSVGSQSVSVRYSAGLLNPKHGRIMRTALIVSEVTPEGKMSESWMLQSSNVTYTWAQVQRFDVWPAYTAIVNNIAKSKPMEFSKFITGSVGVDRSCAQLLADSVCNGPLKPAASYRFKLRLYTAPNLWTDTEYSDTITTSLITYLSPSISYHFIILPAISKSSPPPSVSLPPFCSPPLAWLEFMPSFAAAAASLSRCLGRLCPVVLL
ncbi:hypothetical protein WR25_13324 isoform C [Diploscapter pachys]|uniref:protein-tyrosine-phosphatase n=1 Tax=Diploscapter pachys TaxID=2018661 RepID=A0A2A2LV89_9BILA|nr:hypothetical protein WR25_13324 isoform C [Diploscapter pachys]